MTALSAGEISELRQKHYNATVVGLRMVNDDLMVVRVRPDEPISPLRGGQYTTLGLGYWEPRVPETQAEQVEEKDRRKVIKRAYSISFPVLGENGELLRQADLDYLEFYIVLVRETPGPPPALTPRIFNLRLGDRLFLGRKITGHYTLDSVADGQDVVFLSTGTGEAPHNAMIAELLARKHGGRIIHAVCVRVLSDMGYRETHHELERKNPNFRYLELTTREPYNLDKQHPQYVGKQYIQDLITTGQLEQHLGRAIDPQHTHVFLCGNPAMIGIPSEDDEGRRTYPQPTGVIELLERRGFHADERGLTGSIHFEKYW